MSSKPKGIHIADKPPEPDPDELAKLSLRKIKNIFMVMSGKGGVGKTSVSVNLALALAKKGFKVGLMDVDVHGPDVPRMLGLKGPLTATESQKIKPMAYSENLVAVSVESFMPDKDTAIIWRGPFKHTAIRQFIGDVAWGELDFLIIDAPPGTGDEPLTVAQLIDNARAIIVTTPQEVALADVRKSISFCRTVNLNIFGIVENMSGYVCPHCDHVLDIFGKGGGERTASDASIYFLGSIPFDPNMVKSSDAGVSFLETYADSPVTKAFEKISDKMSELMD
ncbi:MAG: Mrp/NBP35 family ATP-binding protein [Proteobacteria bacterium]|nr:Mrp/NBP35 family ATP-binding protein [Pseudomonadota bacterium]